jgi:L-ascorbate metabolism protein UlaG (beta-lactamase superfamily)
VAVEINYLGVACFRFVKRGLALLIDPYPPQGAVALEKQKADVVLLTDPKLRFDKRAPFPQTAVVVQGAGEYEVGGVCIEGIEFRHPTDNRRQLGYVIDIEGVTYFHPGSLSFVPSESQLDQLTSVDVMFIPIGGGDALDPKHAQEVIDMIEPALVVPMLAADKGISTQKNRAPLEEYLSLCNGTPVDHVESFKIDKGSIAEETRIIIIQKRQ